MFGLEINLKPRSQEELPATEYIYARRPLITIGASESANIAVAEMAELGFELQISRSIGKKFFCKPIALSSNVNLPPFIDGVFEGSAYFDLGPVEIGVIQLDSDLILKDGEAPDHGGCRILRQALASRSPLFPAIYMAGDFPVALSFAPDHPITVGRGKQCTFRVDGDDIAARHSRIGYESGKFWVEELGSVAGTFVADNQIAGRAELQPGTAIRIGRSLLLYGITSEDQITSLERSENFGAPLKNLGADRFPCLISLSEFARPSRFVLTPNQQVIIGRDPICDIWLGAPHISRRHCVLDLTKNNLVIVTDISTNGTGHDGGTLKNNESLEIDGFGKVFDFGNGLTMALCFSAEEESAFKASGGALDTFINNTYEADTSLRRVTQMNLQQYLKERDLGGSPEEKIGWLSYLVLTFKTMTLTNKLFFLSMLLLLVMLLALFFVLVFNILG
ncbi:MAG TPA: FHA domain-containing protein [Oligoflexia bacterium]|nr:FHA domain-containing protein [Oligoflexia bacterium]HMP26653.1 FHA domain-containing protein [Oligoflexia bacterium]